MDEWIVVWMVHVYLVLALLGVWWITKRFEPKPELKPKEQKPLSHFCLNEGRSTTPWYTSMGEMSKK